MRIGDRIMGQAAAWREAFERNGGLAGLIVHPYVLFCVVALLAWLPDGFHIGPVNDGWITLQSTVLNDDHLIKHAGTRIFGSIPRALGLKLVGDSSFAGWQAMLLLLTMLRGILFYEVIRLFLPGNRPFAVACGLIALFHPADDVYFWVDATGVDFDLLVLLMCWIVSLKYLETGKRGYLFLMLMFQILTCFSYTAFMFLMFALPVGAWILRRMEGEKRSPLYLAGFCTLPFLLLIMQFYLAMKGVGREGKVIDTHVGGVISGYLFQIKSLATTASATFSNIHPDYLLIGLVGAGLGAVTVIAMLQKGEATEPPQRSASFYAVLLLGLVGLAVLSYLPYAVSHIRYGYKRQMLVAGIFLYMILAVPFFYWLPARPWVKRFQIVLVAFLALSVTAVGLEKREFWVDQYRAQERLLAAIAAVVPVPPADAVIAVHLHTHKQRWELIGLYNRFQTFSSALKFMYGRFQPRQGTVTRAAKKEEAQKQPGLRGVFMQVGGSPLAFDEGVVLVKHKDHPRYARRIAYDRLIVVDYAPDGKAKILRQHWLRKLAPAGTDISAYAPGGYGTAADENSHVCTMLEPDLRPAYCKAGRR